MTSIKLVEGVSRVLAMERAVRFDLASAVDLLKDCAPAATVLAPIAEELGGFPKVIEGVLTRLTAYEEVLLESEPHGAEETAPSATLGRLYGRLNEAALVCMTLHAFAHRAFESTGEGNLADLAEGHALAYLTTAAAISEAISDVAVWETEQAGEECRCSCPSCGVGVCLCARHGKDTVAKARQASATRPGEQGISVRQPRRGSPAALANLEPGDVIIAAGELTVAGPFDLQRAIRDLPSEADIELTLVRKGTGTTKVTVQR